jgi:diadenylate cyclase
MAAIANDRLEAVFGPVADRTRCSEVIRRTLEQVIELAVEIAREGREGRKIGTLFTVGDVDEVLERSRPLLLDPLYGHAPELLDVSRPEFRETVKELAQLDGAFIVRSDGTFVSAGRFVEVDINDETNFVAGLGSRHAAAASISRATAAIAVVVSQSSVVRVFARGELLAEVIPELFLLSRERLLMPSADVVPVPEAGLTLAVSGDGA